MRSLFDKLDAFLFHYESWLNWFAIAWTSLAVGIILLSNLMNQMDWSPVGKLLPFPVRDNLKIGLLLAPGGVVAVLFLLRGTSLKAKRELRERSGNERK